MNTTPPSRLMETETLVLACTATFIKGNPIVIPFKIIPPAAGQGVIAIQCHKNLEKQKKEKITSLINNKITYFQILAERSLVKNLNGSCKSPISAAANTDNSGNLTLKGSVSNLNGTRIFHNIGHDIIKYLLSLHETTFN